jgi:RNA polymerase sigma-70 factor (ECF subfamily)
MREQSCELDELIRKHGPRVWRSLRYLGVRPADIADASQEVFVVVHRRLPDYRGEAKFETWLYGICLGIARNQRRKQLRAAQHAPQTPVSEAELPERFATDHEAELDQKRMRAALRRALDQISPEQREIFVLHEIEELGMPTVAKTVGCPLFTAYSRLRLARKHLGRLLAREGIGAP